MNDGCNALQSISAFGWIILRAVATTADLMDAFLIGTEAL